jgi:multimeric flavodoxin WrbA
MDRDSYVSDFIRPTAGQTDRVGLGTWKNHHRRTIMRKILIVSSTPRKGGNSEILAEQVAQGVVAAGAEAELVRLRELEIGYCRACMACLKSKKPQCVIEDGMVPMYGKLQKADAIVLATPIYFFTMSGQLKVFLDRLFAIGGSGNWQLLAGKKVAYVMTYGDPNPLESGVTNAYRTFQDGCRFLGLVEVGCVHASCNEAGEVKKNKKVMEAALELGKKLGKA